MSESQPFITHSREASFEEDESAIMLPSHTESDIHGLRSPRRASGRSGLWVSVFMLLLPRAAYAFQLSLSVSLKHTSLGTALLVTTCCLWKARMHA